MRLNTTTASKGIQFLPPQPLQPHIQFFLYESAQCFTSSSLFSSAILVHPCAHQSVEQVLIAQLSICSSEHEQQRSRGRRREDGIQSP